MILFFLDKPVKIHALYTLFETFTFEDEYDYEYKIFSILSSARA